MASGLLMLAVLTVAATTANAGTFPLFGPRSYVRQHGEPVVETASFAVPNPAAPYVLRVDQFRGEGGDDGEHRARATVTLNGATVLRPRDFERHDHELDVPVTLAASNLLGVELRGEPGGGFRLQILGTDNVPPTITATLSPQPDAAGWNHTAVTVSFACADALSGVASCPQPVTLGKQGAAQVVTGTAVDRAGNQATTSVSVNIDETPPTAAFTSPATGSVTANAMPVLAGSFADALSGIDPATLQVTLDGVTVTPQATAGAFTFAPAVPLADGSHQAAFTVADRAGNAAQATDQFSIDTTPPVIAITSPSQTILYNVSSLTVGVSYSDTGSGVDPGTLRWTLDGTAITPPCQAGAAAASCQLGALAGGSHALAAAIRDRAGNQATTAISLDVVADTTPPAITLTLPADGAVLSAAGFAGSTTPLVAARLRDDGAGVDPGSVRLLVDGVDLTAAAQVSASSVTYAPATTPADGAHTAEVDARDFAGNAARAVTHFTLDSLPPALNVAQPASGAPVASVSSIDVTYSDALSGVDTSTLLILLDGKNLTATCTAGATGATCPVPVLGPGTHHLLAQVSDRAGNAARQQVTFGAPRDTTPPTLAITAPSAPIVTGSAPPALAFAYADAGSGIDPASFAVTLDGAGITGQCIAGPSSATCTSPPLARGAHVVAARIRDLAGNLASASFPFTVVLPVPVAFTSPPPGLVTGLPVTQVTGTVALQAISVQVNGVPATLNNGTFAIPAFGLHEGTNNLVAVATDAAGNIGTATIRVTADVTPPIVSITSPADGDVVSSPTITVTGLVNDLTIGTVNQTQANVSVNGVAASVANRGFAATGVTLSPGPNTLTAVATDLAGNHSSSQVHVTLAPAAGAATLQIVSGDGQSGPISTQLPTALTVHVADASGAPLSGVQVVFQVVQGNGQLAGGKRSLLQVTDGQGQAQASWTLGTRAGAGVNRVQVNAVRIARPVTFTALAVAGAPAAIDVASGDNQRGLVANELTEPLLVVVTDAGHNPVANAAVAFQVVRGGGSLGGAPSATLTTDESGLASARFTLGLSPGLDNNLVQAGLPSSTAHPVVLKASAFLPGDPAQTGVRGVVLDNQGAPVPGVTIRLRNSTLTTQTDGQGKFLMGGVPVGQVFLIADASTTALDGSWASLEYELFTLPGVANALPKPIYILPLDLAHGISVSETQGGTVHVPGVPGFALDVAPGSVTFPDGTRSGTISVTAVHADKIPMAPGAGMQPRLIVTIQPAGARFNPPAAMTLPNLDGLAPGSVTELFSFDHSLGAFVSVGTGTVTQDGMTIRSDPGFGVVQAGWHCGAPPSGNGDSACLNVQITNSDPILMDAPPDASDAASSAGPSPQPIVANGSPAQDSVYSWSIADSTVVTSTPSGGGLCPNSSSCTTNPTVAQAGETQVSTTLTSQTTGDTASDQKRVIAGTVKVQQVFSEQQPGSICNRLPPAKGAADATNIPMLMATDGSSSAHISVQTQITPNSATQYMRVGVRQAGTQSLLDDEPATPSKTQLSFPAVDGANLYEVVAGLDLDQSGTLDAGEITYVFPLKVRAFTAADLQSSYSSAEFHKRALAFLNFPFVAGFDAVFLGDAAAPSGAQATTVLAPAVAMHHPLGAGWDPGCQSNIPLFTFDASTALSQAVATSTPIRNAIQNYLVKNQAAVIQLVNSSGQSRGTFTPNPPWTFTTSIGGLGDWGGDYDLALVYGGVAPFQLTITQFQAVKSQNGMGTRYRLTNVAFSGSFQDYFNFDYNFSKYGGYFNTKDEATVEAGFPTPALFNAGGEIFGSMVTFQFNGFFPLILQGP